MLGFCIGNLVYLIDMKIILEEEKLKFKNFKNLVINVLYYKVYYLYLNLEEVLVLIEELVLE